MKTVFTLFVICLFSYSSFAQPGSLDNSFGEAGKVINTSYTSDDNKSLIQPDGKILLGSLHGSYFKNGKTLYNGLLSRYNQDGSLDLKFGDSGRVLCDFGDTLFTKLIQGVALQKTVKL